MKTPRLHPATLFLTLAFAATALCGCSGREVAAPELPDAPAIVSDFEQGTDGWTGAGDFERLRISGGPIRVQGSYLTASDRATGDLWYFVAPRKFVGDRSGYYGGELSFFMLAALADGSAPAANHYIGGPSVILHGAGMRLEYRMNARFFPAPEAFREYRISLDPSPSWRTDGGEPATEEQFRRVLGDLEALWIRGEYFDRDDWAALDEVRLEGRR